MLYVPGSVARFIEKSRTLKVDSLILDLEDPVLPDHKEEARRNVVAALHAGGFGYREKVVRVNALSSPWGRADLAAVATAGADAILFPKIERRQDVLDALAALDAAGAPEMPIMVLIETPAGVLRAEEIAGASPRIACLVVGTSDLTNELHARITPECLPMLHSISQCLLAARANGVSIVDGVHLDLNDMHAFEYACRLARDLGCDGKSLIHPLQIPYSNDAFTPRPSSLAIAKRLIAAFADANEAGMGVAVVDGKLVENLHITAAKRTLMIQEMIEKMEAEEQHL
ncbi:MAG: CoA ester lyase [Sulfuricella sp.]|nr:CoA ester lyase [Sulfuricella sp.]